MARIVFMVWPMTDSVISGLKIARGLRSRGHDVSYLGPADSRPFVEPHGFFFTPLYAGELPETPTADAMKSWSAQERRDYRRSRSEAIRALLEAVASDQNREFQHLVAGLAPDLLIIHSSDFEVVIPSLLAIEAGVACVYLNSILASAEECGLPPLATSIIPNDRWLSAVRIWLAWKKLTLSRRISTALAFCFARGQRNPLAEASRRIAERCRYPRELVGSSDTLRLKARLPELIAWPRRLDFPVAERPGRHYLGCNIDLEREQADFPWDQLDSRPMIYCALGTLTWFRRDQYLAFFQAVLDIAATRPNDRWVVCLYDAVAPEDFASVPANVILVKRAPQLALLPLTKIAIIHGGANSMKECAFFGVPMIVFPIGFDQPGNAARIVYHGLGVRGEIRKISAIGLAALLEQVEKDPFIRLQARLMGEALRAEGNDRGVDFVESLLPGSRREPSGDEPRLVPHRDVRRDRAEAALSDASR
ncbi:hypothetical+protein [Methylocapsa aurea]